MTTLDETALGYPLPHPDNPARTVDVPRLRAALSMIDEHVEALQLSSNALASEKADKLQVAVDIAAAVSQAISDLLDGAPEAYDTLVEIAAKLTDNDDVVAGILSTLAIKANAADVTTALGFKADAAAMTDALALKADKTTVADQLADKASHDQVKAEVQTVSPIGNIVHAAAAPDETYLPLDGSKYLRSAYPGIAPMFAGLPRSATVIPVVNKPGVNLNYCIAAGGYLFALENGSPNKCYRAPAISNGGEAFVEVGSLPQGVIGAALIGSDDGRIMIINPPNSSSAGTFKYSDDFGETWSAPVSFYEANFGTPQKLYHHENYMVIQTDRAIWRFVNNVKVELPWGGSSTHKGFGHQGNFIYAAQLNGLGISRFQMSTGAPPSLINWANSGGIGTKFAFFRGEPVAATIRGTWFEVFRISESGNSQLIFGFDLGVNEGNTSNTLEWFSVVAGAAGGEYFMLAVQHNGGTPKPSLLLLDEYGEIVRIRFSGTLPISAPPTFAGPDVGLILSSSQKYRVLFDTNPETEFRLPNRPNHFIKAVA